MKMRMAESELKDVSQQDESLSGDQAGPPQPCVNVTQASSPGSAARLQGPRLEALPGCLESKVNVTPVMVAAAYPRDSSRTEWVPDPVSDTTQSVDQTERPLRVRNRHAAVSVPA